MDYSVFYLCLYVGAWALTYLRYRKIKKGFDAGSFIILSYLFYAIVSVIWFRNPFSNGMYLPIRFSPFLYLYGMLFISLTPLIKYNSKDISVISIPDPLIVHSISWVIVISTVIAIPSIIDNLSSGLTRILSDSSAGADLYSESLISAENTGRGINNLTSIISNALADIAVFLFFYYLTLEHPSKLLLVGLFLSCFFSMVLPIASGARGGVVRSVFTIFIAYLLFRPFIRKKYLKPLRIMGIVIFILVSVPFIALTNSRFEERDGGSLASNERYLGQANLNFNNYGLDAGGIRYGDRTFNLVKRVFFRDTPKNYLERRAKYPHLKMDDGVFSTFVGDFTLDFGPIGAIIIFLFFNFIICRMTRIINGKIAFHQILLIFFSACICAQGGFSLYSFSDTNGLKIVSLLIVYFITKYGKTRTLVCSSV